MYIHTYITVDETPMTKRQKKIAAAEANERSKPGASMQIETSRGSNVSRKAANLHDVNVKQEKNGEWYVCDAIYIYIYIHIYIYIYISIMYSVRIV